MVLFSSLSVFTVDFRKNEDVYSWPTGANDSRSVWVACFAAEAEAGAEPDAEANTTP